MEGTRYGESAVYGHAPPLDARSRKQRQKGEPPEGGGKRRAGGAIHLGCAHARRRPRSASASERERSLSARSSARAPGALSGAVLLTHSAAELESMESERGTNRWIRQMR